MRSRSQKQRPANEATLFDPVTFEPSFEQTAVLSSLSNTARPTTLVQLKERYGLSVLKLASIQDRPEQVSFANIFFTRREQGHQGTVLRKGTGRGKSFDGLIVAASELSGAGRVLIITSRNMLVQQFSEYARTIFDLEPNSIVEHSNAKIPTDRRAAMHCDRAIKLVVSTGETIRNDLAKNQLNPKDYSLLIIDEALHNTVGDYAYVPVLSAFRKAGVAFLALDATPANTREQLQALGQIYSLNPATDFFNVGGDTQFQPTVIEVAASTQVTKAAWRIAAQVADAAGAMVRPSTEEIQAERQAGMALFYALRDAILLSLSNRVAQLALSEFIGRDLASTKAQFEICCKSLLADVYHGHPPAGLLHNLSEQIDQQIFSDLSDQLERAPRSKLDNKTTRSIVGQAACGFANSMRLRMLKVDAALNPLVDNFDDIIGDSTQNLIGPMRGVCVEINKCLAVPGLALSHQGKYIRRFTCEAGELARFHEQLTSYGAITFLTEYIEKRRDFAARSVGQKPQRAFEAAIYRSTSRLYAAARELAEGSAFADFFSSQSNLHEPASTFSTRISQAQLHELYKGKLVTPKEWQMYDLIKQELYQNPNARILVFADQISAAAQYADAITLWSHSEHANGILTQPINAHFISGSGSMSARVRQQRKRQFESGELQVLVITSVAIEGAHFEGAETLIEMSHLSNPGKLNQLMGRAGHDKNAAKILQIVAATSPDAPRLERASARLHAAESTLELMKQIPNLSRPTTG